MGGKFRAVPGDFQGEYTVTSHRFGTLIRGSIPIDDMLALIDSKSKRAKEDGETAYLHPGIAQCNDANFCITSYPEEWMAEIEEAIEKAYPDDLEAQWLNGPRTGISSLTLFSVLAENRDLANQALARAQEQSPPKDGDDWQRCHWLVDRLGWADRIQEVADKYPAWKGLAKGWPTLVYIYGLWKACPGDTDTNSVKNQLGELHDRMVRDAVAGQALPSLGGAKKYLKKLGLV